MQTALKPSQVNELGADKGEGGSVHSAADMVTGWLFVFTCVLQNTYSQVGREYVAFSIHSSAPTLR